MTFPDYADGWHQRPGWPAPDEIAGLVKDLTGEIRGVLDGWVIWPGVSGMVKAYAGAALWHCCVLLERMEEAHARGDELVGRILSRALVESWFVGLYLHYGKAEALDAVAAGYRDGLIKQHQAIAEHDDRIRRRRREATKRNKAIARENANFVAWNTAHPDLPPKRLYEPAPVPTEQTIDFDSKPAIARLAHIDPQRLPVSTIVARLAGYTKGTEDETTFSVAYDLTYRGLSGLGAHPTLWVLNSYLDNRAGTGIMIRIRDETGADPLAQPNLDSGLLLVSGLSARLLGAHGVDTPIADSLVARYNLDGVSSGDPLEHD